MSKLVNGLVPHGKKCPFEFNECKYGKGCNLYRYGTRDGKAGPKGFSCALARGLDMIQKRKGKEKK